MAVTSSRKTQVDFSGDYTLQYISIIENLASPGDIDIQNLILGANTITLPGGGATVKGCVIVPPSGNTSTLTVKGIAGDTGIVISKTEPTSIAFDSTALPANFVINASAAITGMKFIWT